MKPKEYIGIDIEPGKLVDIILPAERLVEYFGKEKIEVVISTELLEHVRDWRLVVNNMKRVLKRDGYISLRGPTASPIMDIHTIFGVMR